MLCTCARASVCVCVCVCVEGDSVTKFHSSTYLPFWRGFIMQNFHPWSPWHKKTILHPETVTVTLQTKTKMSMCVRETVSRCVGTWNISHFAVAETAVVMYHLDEAMTLVHHLSRSRLGLEKGWEYRLVEHSQSSGCWRISASTCWSHYIFHTRTVKMS